MTQAVDALTVKRWLDAGEAVLVDVREPAEHASERIDGATLMPLSRLDPAALQGVGGKKLVIHCRKGARGQSACQTLLAAQPELEVYNLDGGLSSWVLAGLPILSSGRRVLPLDQQVQLTIGLCVLTFALLGVFVSPLYAFGAAFFGAGLIFAGLTGFCGLARVMALMPWNRAPQEAIL